MRILVSATLLASFSSSVYSKDIQEKEFYRLEESARIIDRAAKSYWPGAQGFRGPWVYVTSDGQYLINYPKPMDGFENVGLKPYKNSAFKPKRMQWRNKGQVTLNNEDHSADPVFVFNSVSTEPKDIEYRNPILYASSIEIVKKVVPLADTEDWLSLVLHEAFHQFQFSNKDVFNQYTSLKVKGVYLDSSALANIYAKNDWFKSGILEENRLLLEARNQRDREAQMKILRQFSELRKNRRNHYQKQFGKSIAETEALWEMLEGGARYFEYATFRVLHDTEPNSRLEKVDPLYGSNKRYQKPISTELMENLDRDPKRTRYFYTTGFNLCLLLEEIYPKFQERLFSASPLYAEQLLGL
jgi:hypothetical protein